MSILRRITQSALSLLCLSTLAACSFAPDYEQPEMVMPEAWMSVNLKAPPLEQDWWKRFDDPALTKLIEEALKNNQDIDEALAKVDSAAAQIGQARSALFPSINGTGSTARTSQSIDSTNVSQSNFEQGLLKRATSSTQIGFGASWELDLWGKYRNSYTGLSDVLLSTKVGYDALRLSIAGQVAQGYFTLLALDMQLATAKRTFESRKKSLRIYAQRFKQGETTELDWLRAESEMELSRASMLNTIVERDAAEAALAVLLGRSPKEILQGEIGRGFNIEKMPAPPVLPAGLPSDLLLRRPDIRAAEYMVMAYNANIGVVTADLFPSISLTGNLGSMSSDIGRLFTGPAGLWSYGANVAMPILDFGRRWYAIEDAEALKRQSIALYRKTIQTAFQDVRTAFTSQREANGIVKSVQKQVDNNRRALNLARLQYDNGYADYLTVLDAERQLFTAELSLASAMSHRLNSVVRVCLALGGGWSDTTPDMGTKTQAKKAESAE